MHPKEAYRQKTGTGRLAALSLINSEIIIGVDFSLNKRLNRLISGEGDCAQYYPVLLFPSKDAYFTDTPSFREVIGTKKLLVILVDATWYLAEKILKLSTNLKHLPKLSFKNEYRSQFNIKLQPDPVCLSTIESSHYLIEELKTAGIVNPTVDQSGLMKVFHQMVKFQQLCTQSRHEEEAYSRHPELFTRNNTTSEMGRFPSLRGDRTPLIKRDDFS
jgi:DTW domain-containing protein YfiP